MALNPAIQHAEYVEHSPQWAKCNDAIEGEDAIHKAGEKYLPRLKEQTDADYQSYVMRTPFYNATARTIDGLTGMLFRKAPTITAPTGMDAILKDITLTCCDIDELAEDVAREYIGIGKVALLVEYPQVRTQGMTQAQASSLNMRPYVTKYEAENIINWRYERVNNVKQPVMIALSEQATSYVSEFECVSVDQIRALLLVDGKYLQRVYQQNDKKEWVQIVDDIVPLMNNAPLSYIPIEIFCTETPPLYDLVTLNISHYRTTADFEHGCHFTGLPTAVVSGYQATEGEKLSIGSSTAWIFQDPAAKASYLEFTGQGLGALEKNMRAKENMMASLGARMLAAEKTGVEAQGTVKLRHSGESAVLSSIADCLSAGLSRILQIVADWSSVNSEVVIVLNKDFADNGLTAQELTALVASWQSGAMSSSTLHWNLQQGELIPVENTFEIEQDLIATQNPQLGVV